MSLNKFRFLLVALLFGALIFSRVPFAVAAPEAVHGPNTTGSLATESAESAEKLTGHDVGPAGGGVEKPAGEHGEEKAPGTFDPHAGTWLHPLTQLIFGQDKVGVVEHNGEKHFTNIQYDVIVVSIFTMALIALLGVLGARKMKVRPDGKPASLSHIVETSAEGFRNYLIGIMGPDLAGKYAPLISSFFFTILFFNWMGLVPGMLAPTANPNVPVALALVAFVCTHFIAIKEAGFKSWFMHFVGEPIWLAPLNFPLHLIGELIKPLSLSIRLLCNVFGEEMVALQLALLAVGAITVLHFPVPFQLPMLLLGSFFGLLQALVFATLLAIYVSILSTHHDDHDANNLHGHVEHIHFHGYDEVVAHPSESPTA